MNKLFYSLIGAAALFVFANISYAAGDGVHRGGGDGVKGGHHTQTKQQYWHNDQDRNDHQGYKQRYNKDRDDYKGRRGYNYSHRVGQQNYYYNNYYQGSTYHGHFKNRSAWNSYYRAHPEYARHGRYEIRDGVRFFVFNDGQIGFSFSIGN